MKPRKANYLIHRWLGLIVSLQLLAWSVGGFMFSVLEIENVRGERDVAAPPYEPIGRDAIDALPQSVRPVVAGLASRHPGLATVALIDRGVGPAWEVRSSSGELIARLDPASGEALSRITPDEARRIAERDFAHPDSIARVELLSADPPVEYRAGPLPAYRIEFDHPKRLHLYVDAQTGQVTARRNQVWRIFDFFWMLHTMDYRGRDDFNHPLLTTFSLLAIATSGSGVALWGWRAANRIERTRPRGKC